MVVIGLGESGLGSEARGADQVSALEHEGHRAFYLVRRQLGRDGKDFIAPTKLDAMKVGVPTTS